MLTLKKCCVIVKLLSTNSNHEGEIVMNKKRLTTEDMRELHLYMFHKITPEDIQKWSVNKFTGITEDRVYTWFAAVLNREYPLEKARADCIDVVLKNEEK